MVVRVFEPTHLVVGKSYPLVLQGHGYGGSRETTAPDGSFIKRLNDAGYYVISIDERGFGRSEEHTSELQSLMRISYAVFCLKKKTDDSTSMPCERSQGKTSHHISIMRNSTSTISI